ncbi:MAG: hypothetical protein WKF37_03470 [Bryobacteraceae bacterium]
MNNREASDTITVTWNGGATVDLRKLLAKPHIRKLLSDIHGKVRIVPEGYSGPSMVPKNKP